jgi:hypothetical protein
MAAVGGVVLAGAGSPPGVSWSDQWSEARPYVWIILALVAAMVYVAFRMRTRRSKRVFAGALAALAITTMGTAVWGYHAVTLPLDDASYFCNSPDPSPPSSIVADSILQACAAGTTVMLSRGQTVAVALAAESSVDRWAQWTDLSVSDRNVVSAFDGSPYTLPGPPTSHVEYEVAVFRANQPGETTISAIYRGCAASLGCDRGIRWWVTIEVT